MVTISPQQELFTAVKKVVSGLGYTVYDYLPMDDVPYPFVFLGEDLSTDIPNKTAIHGSYNLTLHIYNDQKKRGTTSTMMMNIKQALRELKHTQGFYISVNNINDQIIQDTTTNIPLSHGIIDVEFYFN